MSTCRIESSSVERAACDCDCDCDSDSDAACGFVSAASVSVAKERWKMTSSHQHLLSVHTVCAVLCGLLHRAHLCVARQPYCTFVLSANSNPASYSRNVAAELRYTHSHTHTAVTAAARSSAVVPVLWPSLPNIRYHWSTTRRIQQPHSSAPMLRCACVQQIHIRTTGMTRARRATQPHGHSTRAHAI